MLAHPKNNFDFIRMMAALCVLYSHQHALMGLPEPSVLNAHSLGGFAVLVFFSISGFLVAQSWQLDPNIWRFAVKRLLRVWPGLAVAIVLTALVLGPWVSPLPLGEYYAHPLIPEYLLNLRFAVRDALPLQFTGSGIPGAVNGALWTIPLELKCYAALLLLGFVGALRFKWLVPVMTLVAATVYLYLYPGMDALLARLGLTSTFNYLMQFSLFFFAGVSLYGLGIHQQPRRAAWAVALAVGAAGIALALDRPLVALWLAVPTLTLAFGNASTPGVRSAGRYGDLSYGIYIYAFPVQQTIIWLFRDSLSWWPLLVIIVAITVLLALLSWHLVENPALQFKPKRKRNQPARPDTSAIGHPAEPVLGVMPEAKPALANS